MDHRWDEMLQAEHRKRVEQSRYASRPIESDEDVERRDQLAEARRRVQRSPWDIGAAHWYQRDLYTKSSAIDDSGYGHGPAVHPEIGSYAYERYFPIPHHELPTEGPNIYEREAWPWLNYHEQMARADERDPRRGWRRSDEDICDDVRDSIASDPHLDARDIEVEVENAEVTLKGTVPSRHDKRHAERIAELRPGVHDVHNRLVIRKDDDDLTFTAPIPAY